MRILLVGGAVRNLLLGRPVRDRDYLVLDATVEDFLRAHPAAKAVGKTFPVCILGGSEYAFVRGETLEQDLGRRDFTVNAMALDERGRLSCHPLALDDLRHRVLRPASPDALADDPVRAYRAARFLAELPDFAAHPELLERMRDAAGQGLMAEPYAERVGREVQKACAAERPGNFLRLLDAGGCLAPWLGEFSGASAIPAGPPQHHDASVLEHTERVMDALADVPQPETAMAVWMGLCHDLGKATTQADRLPRHIGHEERGEALARALGLRLRLPTRLVEAGADAARWHMTAGRYRELRDATRVDLLFRLKARGCLREMFRLTRADKGLDLLPEAQADLDAALTARLPAQSRNQGEASGEFLRSLRIQALRAARRSRNEA